MIRLTELRQPAETTVGMIGEFPVGLYGLTVPHSALNVLLPMPDHLTTSEAMFT
jgi:hypothetical protein